MSYGRQNLHARVDINIFNNETVHILLLKGEMTKRHLKKFR